jgi:hypothetical protein
MVPVKEVFLMRAFRVIFLACLIFVLAGSAFAKNDKGGNSQGGTQGGNSQGGSQGGNSQGGKGYAAPEFDLRGPLKYELLLIAGGAVLLLERRRRRRRVSLDK